MTNWLDALPPDTLPALWLGAKDLGMTVEPYWRARNRERSLVLREGASWPRGIQAFDHSYGGESCLSIYLAGAILPLRACRDRDAANRLVTLAASFDARALPSYFPDLDQLVAIRDAFRAIGPLDATNAFMDTAHGFLNFAVQDDGFEWIRRRFSPIDANGAEAPWPGETLDAYTTALVPGPGRVLFEGPLAGALLYASR